MDFRLVELLQRILMEGYISCGVGYDINCGVRFAPLLKFEDKKNKKQN